MSKEIKMDAVNFANIQTPNYIQETYTQGRGYIPFGANNLFPQELILYSDKSTTHSACLNLIKMSIAGEGFKTDNDDAKSWLELQDYETSNSTNLEKNATAMSIFDGCVIEVIWSKTGKQIVEIHPIPFEDVRVASVDSYGNAKSYTYNRDWERHPSNYEVVMAFDPKIAREFPKQYLYIGLDSIVSKAYPIPKYCSAINYIAAENELSKHNLSSIVNGFLPAALVTFYGNPTKEDREFNKNLFRKNFEGSENTGKVIIAYAETLDKKVEVDILQANNAVDYYMNSSQENKERIITAHNIISPALIAIGEGNSLFGNADELRVSWDVFYNTKIKSYQKLLQKSYNMILKYAGFPDANYQIIPFSPVTIVEDKADISQTTGNEIVTDTLPAADGTTSEI